MPHSYLAIVRMMILSVANIPSFNKRQKVILAQRVFKKYKLTPETHEIKLGIINIVKVSVTQKEIAGCGCSCCYLLPSNGAYVWHKIDRYHPLRALDSDLHRRPGTGKKPPTTTVRNNRWQQKPHRETFPQCPALDCPKDQGCSVLSSMFFFCSV